MYTGADPGDVKYYGGDCDILSNIMICIVYHDAYHNELTMFDYNYND